jgi:hypothetical protein
MCDGWNKSGPYSHEWTVKTQKFVDDVFSLSATTQWVLMCYAYVQIVVTINAKTKEQ